MAEPGWYDDPENPASLRWWDGSAWTQSTRPNIVPDMPPSGGPEAPGGGGEPGLSAPALPPWLANVADNDGDESYDEDEDDYDDTYGDDDEGESLFQRIQRADSEPPDVLSGGSDRPPILERGPRRDDEDRAVPLPPWMRDTADETGDSVGDSVGGDAVREVPRERAAPPWLQNRERDPAASSRERSVDPDDERLPPWLRDRQSGQERTPERSAFRSDYDDDDDDFGERRVPPSLRGRNEPRVASWEEMADDYDEEPDGSRAKIKKIVVLAAGVLAGVLILYMLYSIFFGGSDEGGNDNEQTIEVVEVGEWARWPDAEGGYVVEFPEPPDFIRGGDRHIWTVTIDQGEQDNGDGEGGGGDSPVAAVYQLTQRFVDPNAINAATFDDRVALVQNLLLEQNPGFAIEGFEAAAVGGAPARQFTLSNGTTQVRCVVVLTVDTIYSLCVNETGDFERFTESFQWFRAPEFPTVAAGN